MINIRSSELEISVQSKDHAAVKLLLALIEDNNNLSNNMGNINNIGNILSITAKALERSKQFKAQIERFKKIKTKKEITDLFDLGYCLVIFIEQVKDEKSNDSCIYWRLYDTRSAQMIKGKKIYSQGTSTAYHLADDLWESITCKPGCFSNKIAYIKRKKDSFSRESSSIYVANFDGSDAKEIVKTFGTYIGLNWNKNIKNPNIFVSEFTPYNVRVVSFNLYGNKKKVLDFNGTCVGISCSEDNNYVVYCKSGTIWSYSFDANRKRGVHNLIIKNDGKNLSPILLKNLDIIFCSDSPSLYQSNTKDIKNKKRRIKIPKIYYYHHDTKNIELITQEGYCVDPAYCHDEQKIIYSRKVNDVMQLFVYDMQTQKHTQITFDKLDKTDSSWSPCGSYILFCCSGDNSSRIAMINFSSREKWFITNTNEFCISPSWQNGN